MLEMFKGVANSPETTITNDINNTDTIIYVLDETRIPEDLPNLMVLGTGVSAETIKVLSIDGNALTVERGFQGVPRSWNAGTVIARNFTEYDYNALVENVKTLKGNTDTNADDILSLMNYVGNLDNLDTDEKSNIVLALNEIYQDLDEHKAEKASQTKLGHVYSSRGAMLKVDTYQSIPNGVYTSIVWDRAEYDDMNIFNVADPTIITIPTGVSKIRVTVNLSSGIVDAASEFNVVTRVLKNGQVNNTPTDGRVVVPVTSSDVAINLGSNIINVLPGDTISVSVLHRRGDTFNVSPQSFFLVEVVE